jgi:hypothetical protein
MTTRVEIKLSDELLVVLDRFDMGPPFVSLTFYAIGPHASMPSFSVGLPFDKWAEFQATIAAYSPVPKALKQ